MNNKLLTSLTIQEAFLKNIELSNHAGITFIEDEGNIEYMSYKKLYMEARYMLHDLQEKGIQPGDELVLQFMSNKKFLITFWACIFGKIIPVPIVFGVTIDIMNKICNVWKRLKNPYLITDLRTFEDSWREYSQDKSESTVDIDTRFLLFEDITYTKQALLLPANPSDLVFIQFSSGSTGNPKGIENTQSSIIYNINTMSELIALQSSDQFLGWMPLTHDLGLIFFHLFPLLTNKPQFLIPPVVFYAYPNLWLKSLAKYNITVSGSPNFGYRHVIDNFNEDELAGYTFDNLRMMINGAEQVSVANCRKFEKMLFTYGLAPRTIIPSYGLAESVVGVSIFQSKESISREFFVNRHKLKIGEAIEFVDANTVDAISFANLGRYTGTEIKITDENMQMLSNNTLGLIHLRSKAVTSGFYNDIENTRKIISEDGWLNTGDLGFISDGQLVLTGRDKEMIIINGQNYFPNDIDDIIDELPDVHFQQAISCSLLNESTYQEEILIFLHFQGSVKDFIVLENLIKEYVEERTGLWIKKVIAVERIPRTTSGKVQRYILLEEYLQGKYDAFIKKTETEKGLLEIVAKNDTKKQIEDELLTIWKELLKYNPTSTRDNFFQLGGNSLTMIRLISRIHKHFGVQVGIKEAFDNRTIEAQAALIAGSLKIDFAHINPAAAKDYYPQSSIQKRIFILDQMNPGMTAYNVPVVFKVDGDIDIELLENAIQQIINRHEALRTSFHLVNEEPVQKIHENIKFQLVNIQDESESLDSLINNFIREFDLSIPPLIRVGLIRKDNEIHLIIDMHHIITDGISYTNLLEEIIALYNNHKLKPIGIQYKDYSEWQLHREENKQLENQQQFWLAKFKDIPEILNLPTDFQRPQVNNFKGTTITFKLNAQKYKQLREICLKHDVTMYTLLLAILNILISKLSGQEDITIGTSTAGRQHIDTEKLIGAFIHTLPIRNFPKRELDFIEFLQNVNDSVLQCFANQDFPYEQLIEKLGLNIDLSHNPLFDIMFEYYSHKLSEFKIKGAYLSPIEFNNNSSKLDLSFRVFERVNTIDVLIDFRTNLFRENTVKRFCSYFTNILNEVILNNHIKLCEINMLSIQEIDILNNIYNKTKIPYQRDVNITAIFEQQVEQYSDRIAVSDGNRTLTYRELNQQANKVANYLITKGISQGNMVGLLFDRSVDMIISIIGVLKTGGIYLPIDPTLPEQRINYMLNQSQAVLLLSQEKYLDTYTSYLPTLTIYSSNIVWQSNANISINIQPTDFAYCIFTSGSSGRAKGVMINHRSVINLVKGLEQEVYHPYGDKVLRVALLASFSFDASVQQIYGCLLLGHSLYIADDNSRRDGEKLRHFYELNDIDLSDGTPTHLRLLTDILSRGTSLGHFSSWILAGETLSKELVKEFYSKAGKQVQLYNFYGPTETCVDSTGYKIDMERIDDYPFIPIGKPLPNERIYITNVYGELVPVGVIGELCIAGDGLAQCYVGDEVATSEKFRSDWISGEERVYRTGDMARWLPDGNLEYCGRIDRQIKLRGYRIELLEIENQLNAHPYVNYCAVDLKGTESDKFLVAYYESPSEIAAPELRRFLSDSLPDYMIPSYYMWVNKLPLTNNGKVDRNSLPDYIFRNNGSYVPPFSETEKKLVEIWADVLKIDAKLISTTDNFFDLGGQSLKLVFLANRIKDIFKTSISLQKIALLQNIQEQAKVISSSVGGEHFIIPKANISDFYPLSYAQKQFYLLNQLNNKSTVYNQPQAFFIEGNPDKVRLQDTFQKLIAHHEIFRTLFKVYNDSPVQCILDEVTFELEYFESSRENCNEVISKFIRPFDLSIAPLLRVCLIRLEEEKYLLIIDRHHIISDGISLDIFIRDFLLLYQGKELSSASLEYRDYAMWQQGNIYQNILTEQKLYWNQIFSIPFTNIELPTDYERPAITSYHGAKIDFSIDLKHTQLLKKIAGSLNITQFSVILGIFKILLYKLSGQNDIIVGTPVSGRRNTEIEHTIGVFINVLPIRSHIESYNNVFNFLKSVNHNVILGLENQDYPFEKLVTDLEIARNANRNPLYDVMFVYREEEALNVTLQGITFKTYELDSNTSQMDLILHVNAIENEMQLSFQYAKDLFDQASIKNFIKYFNQIVEQVVLNTTINEINILEAKEEELIKKFNQSDRSFEINANIVELFEKQAYEFPDRKAVVFSDMSLSYKELNECSNQLAACLIDKGIIKGDIIGLLVNRNADIIIGILGILKSGGAYLPIDHKLPSERISYMLESSNAKLLLGHMEHLKIFHDQIDTHDINSFDANLFSSDNLHIERYPSDLAYCIFTSGSTGTPKGVLIEDRSIVNLVMGLNSTIYENLGSSLRIGLIASYSFDASCQQIYSSLLNAHTLFICSENERVDGEQLYQFYERNGIHVTDGTPTHFRMFLRNLNGVIHLPELKTWLLAGEVLSKELVYEFYGYPDAQHIVLYNLYGPTEACVDSTCYKIDSKKLEQFKTIPIGRPLPNERIYIVDEYGNSVPKRIVGELCIAGTGLARGYIDNISNNKFVENWIKGEERVYRSGDLAYWLPDGNIIYKERIDNQIKLRGYRIEPGEIEQVLLSHVAILESVVVLVNIDGENYLTAYYLSTELLNDEQLREYLTLRLPQYMVPSFFVHLDTIPLSPNGKLNRNTLPIPNRMDINLFVNASTETEKRLINIWAEVLNIPPQSISANQSFLQLGGNSLSAMQIANKIKKEFKIDIKLVNIFLNTTILQQGNYIDDTLWIKTEKQPFGIDNQEINI